MTFKRFVMGAVLFSCIFILSILIRAKVYAEETGILPAGEILIVYSDGADQTVLEDVRSIVEILTFQSFQVTYAPASRCLGQLGNYSHIICYDPVRFPAALIWELYAVEQEGLSRLEAVAEGEIPAAGIQIMFIGNEFLRQYFTKTSRGQQFLDVDKTVGKITYYFNDYTSKEVLAKEKDFLFLTGELTYRSGIIEIETQEGYFCAEKGVISHIPVIDMNNSLIRAAFTREVAQWKWPYNGEPHIYAQYMVLNQVYPFQDPDKLQQVVELLIAQEEPFIISVMPIYVNADYPAMQHFCEVLRYAQNHGGAIVMHSPVNQMTSVDVNLMNEYIAIAIGNYLEQGVYPIGIQVPRNWMFNEATIEIMSRFRTVLVDAEDDPNIAADEKAVTNLVYRDGHQWIAPAISLDTYGVSYTRVNSTAVTIDITEDFEQIKARINACRASYVPLKSLWDIEHSLWTDEDILTYRNHIIYVNNKRVEKTFAPAEYEEKFSYNRNMLQRFSKDLAAENRKLVVAVVVVSLLFLLFILIARRNNKKRFLIKDSPKVLPEDFRQTFPEEMPQNIKPSGKMQTALEPQKSLGPQVPSEPQEPLKWEDDFPLDFQDDFPEK